MQKNVEKIIKNSTSEILPEVEINELVDCINNSDPPVSIRLNPKKIKNHILNNRISWSDYGYYMNTRPAFTYDPFLHAGIYYVQEASSMFIEEIFRQLNLCSKPLIILDICAAPGGKSTLISSAIHRDSILVSNEIDRHRCNILAENISKWGGNNILVSNNRPEDFSFLKNYFDVTLADLPCSGEGMFRKDKNSINEWSEQNVFNCSIKQKKISDDIIQTLKPGGYYIYSTCTFNKNENENNIDYLIKKHELLSVKINIDKFDGIYHSLTKHGANCYRFFPHRINGEGLFVCVLQKSERGYKTEKTKSQQKFTELKNICREICERYEINTLEKKLYEINAHVYCMKEEVLKALAIFGGKLNIVQIPTALFEIKNKDYIPTQPFANANYLKNKAIDLNYIDAINYLMGININLNCADGFHAVGYKNAVLGWIKKMGLRTNNYYPKEWRIRHSNKNEPGFLLSDYIETN